VLEGDPPETLEKLRIQPPLFEKLERRFLGGGKRNEFCLVKTREAFSQLFLGHAELAQEHGIGVFGFQGPGQGLLRNDPVFHKVRIPAAGHRRLGSQGLDALLNTWERGIQGQDLLKELPGLVVLVLVLEDEASAEIELRGDSWRIFIFRQDLQGKVRLLADAPHFVEAIEEQAHQIIAAEAPLVSSEAKIMGADKVLLREQIPRLGEELGLSVGNFHGSAYV